MKIVTLAMTAAGATALAFSSTLPATTGPQERSVLDFPVPAEAFSIPLETDGSPTTMMDMFVAYCGATGQIGIVGAETRNYLTQATVGATHDMTIPPENVQTTIEAILLENDFLLHVLTAESPRLLGITSLNTGARNTVRQKTRFIDVADADQLEAHPAMLFTTVVNLPNTDVRQLSNSMRTMITDANTQQMLPMGNTNSMLLTGPGAAVAQLVEQLYEVDARSTPTIKTVPVLPKKQGK